MQALLFMDSRGRLSYNLLVGRASVPAIGAALRRAEEEILRDHVAHCVAHAISSGDKADQRRKVAELMDVMGRAGR